MHRYHQLDMCIYNIYLHIHIHIIYTSMYIVIDPILGVLSYAFLTISLVEKKHVT